MSGFAPAVRKIVRERASDFEDYPACEVMAYCQGHWASIELHHRRTRAAGGTKRKDSNQAANALACCSDCHKWITEHPTMSRKFGWVLRQNETPSEVPVLRRGQWVLLSDGGDVTRVPKPIEESA